MIRHVVMWELNDAAQAQAFCGVMSECRSLVAGMRGFELATRCANLPASVDVCLIATFDDAHALRAYQNHPVHLAVSQRLAPMRRQRHVLDFEVNTGAAP